MKLNEDGIEIKGDAYTPIGTNRKNTVSMTDWNKYMKNHVNMMRPQDSEVSVSNTTNMQNNISKEQR